MPTTTIADTLVSAIFERHLEAVIIYVDPDDDKTGEFKIGVFTKLRKTGILSGILVNILENLRGKDAKTHNRKAKSSTNKRKSSTTAKRLSKSRDKTVNRKSHKLK